MQTRWTKGLDAQQEKDLKLQLVAAKNVLERITYLVEEDIKSSARVMESKTNYENSSWAYQQADTLGEIRAYKRLLRLLNLEDK